MNREVNIVYPCVWKDVQEDSMLMGKQLIVNARLNYWKKRKPLLFCVGFLLLCACIFILFFLPVTAMQTLLFGFYAAALSFVLLSLLIPSLERWVAERLAGIMMKRVMKRLKNQWTEKSDAVQDMQALRVKLDEEKIEVFRCSTPDDAGVFLGCVKSEERLQYCSMESCILLKSANISSPHTDSAATKPFLMCINLQRLQPQEQKDFLDLLTGLPWCEPVQDAFGMKLKA